MDNFQIFLTLGRFKDDGQPETSRQSHVDESTAKELYALIGLLEGYAAKLVVGAITQKVLSNMDFYVASMNLAIDSGNDEMYYQIQAQFHDVYLSLCDNKTLLDTLAQMKKKFVRKVYRTEGISDMGKGTLPRTTLERMLDTVIGVGTTSEDSLEEAACWHADGQRGV